MLKRTLTLCSSCLLAAVLITGTASAAAPTFSSTPPAVTNGATQTFEFSYPGATAYTCALDGATPTSCASPHTLTAAPEGAHTLAVTAMWMNMTQICIPMPPGPDICTPISLPAFSDPASFSFTIDRTGPAVVFSGGTKSLSSRRTTSASFSFTPETGGSIQCKLDKRAAVACGNSINFTRLKPGVHRLTATASDALGNTGAASTLVFATNSSKLKHTFVSKGKKVKRCKKGKRGRWSCKTKSV